MRINYVCLLVTLLFWSCSDDRDIRDYYFPVRALEQGKVYVYSPQNSPDTNDVYWYALGLDQDTALYLNMTTYDAGLTPSTLISEKITNAGVVTKQVYIFATDSTGISQRTEAKVLAGNSFPFFVPAATAPQPAYVYQIDYSPVETPGVNYRITYNRQFSRDTTAVVDGKEVAAIVLSMTGETSVQDPVNGDISPGFKGYEIYAKDIGLVESYRNFDGFVLHQKLKERISMQLFQERAKRMMDLLK